MAEPGRFREVLIKDECRPSVTGSCQCRWQVLVKVTDYGMALLEAGGSRGVATISGKPLRLQTQDYVMLPESKLAFA